MTPHEKLIQNMYDKIHIQASITCTKCHTEETIHNCDEIDAMESFIRCGWHATPTKAYCPTCNPYKVIRDKK